MRTLDACRGVFDYDATRRQRTDSLGRQQKHLRVGLAALNIFGRRNRREVRTDRQHGQDRLDVLAWCGRRDCLAPACRMQPFEPAPNPWQQLDATLAHELTI